MFETFSDVDERVSRKIKVCLMPISTITSDNAATVDVSKEKRKLEILVDGLNQIPQRTTGVTVIGHGLDAAKRSVMMTRQQYRMYVTAKYEKCIDVLEGREDFLRFDVPNDVRDTLLAYYRFALKIEDNDAITITCPDGCDVSLAIGQLARIEYDTLDVIGVVTELRPTYHDDRSVVIISMAYIGYDFEDERRIELREIVIDADALGSGKINVTRFTPLRSQSVDKLKTIVDCVLVIRALLTNYESLLPLSLLSYQAVADGLMPFKNKIDEVLTDENDG